MGLAILAPNMGEVGGASPSGHSDNMSPSALSISAELSGPRRSGPSCTLLAKLPACPSTEWTLGSMTQTFPAGRVVSALK